MNTCSTCKHRGDDPLTPYRGADQKPTTYYECRAVTMPGYEEYPPGLQALVMDGSGYMAMLCVEDTFGCIKWAPK